MSQNKGLRSTGTVIFLQWRTGVQGVHWSSSSGCSITNIISGSLHS